MVSHAENIQDFHLPARFRRRRRRRRRPLHFVISRFASYLDPHAGPVCSAPAHRGPGAEFPLSPLHMRRQLRNI